MARPRKNRRVCHIPISHSFLPAETSDNISPVIMTMEEYETIRLMDRENLTQEACAAIMQVARTTVQQIYTNARQKLALMLTEGRPLLIQGGNYQLCQGNADSPYCQGCTLPTFTKPKGDHIMRIAVTYENGQIFQHFGHTAFFKVYDVAEGKVVASEVVSTNGSGHGALAGVLNVLHADVLICGGIGGGAQAALAQHGIRLYGGVQGDADAAVEALLAGNLDFNPNVMCSHHGDHHHDHSCGSHGCGSHNCGHL